MGYEISIDDRNGIAEIRLAEPMPHREHVKARDELLEICRARNIRKILVDARTLTGSPTTMELFDFGTSWAEHARRTPIFLAGVIPQDIASRKWWKFGETVAVNRGLATRAFDDFEEAVAWLRKA